MVDTAPVWCMAPGPSFHPSARPLSHWRVSRPTARPPAHGLLPLLALRLVGDFLVQLLALRLPWSTLSIFAWRIFVQTDTLHSCSCSSSFVTHRTGLSGIKWQNKHSKDPSMTFSDVNYFTYQSMPWSIFKATDWTKSNSKLHSTMLCPTKPVTWISHNPIPSKFPSQ